VSSRASLPNVTTEILSLKALSAANARAAASAFVNDAPFIERELSTTRTMLLS
jgi:hypothetical protein